jgi:hypothetical protein
MSEWHDGDDDWADPAIRLEFEAALGKFILTHNEADFHTTYIIRLFAQVHFPGNPRLQELANGNFSARMAALMLLQGFGIDQELSHVDLRSLANLNTIRNQLAHGHFDQNPFDGSYSLILQKNRSTQQKQMAFPVSVLNKHQGELAGIVDQLNVTAVVLRYTLTGD